jgi:hypothetical protein
LIQIRDVLLSTSTALIFNSRLYCTSASIRKIIEMQTWALLCTYMVKRTQDRLHKGSLITSPDDFFFVENLVTFSDTNCTYE